ncbi:hypothetical protein BJ875DRAFT_457245 [Amylocarpus encephaloides]|uniref:Myb-like domain-containing protein n=1 Tax=Amylocarpus encephaloides TaxID=45428 RepID=A0A9P8C6X3_9HELO|nr:hypothetical protein BJ875DRAFT_457245 [Amylocarpus encephaloides]
MAGGSTWNAESDKDLLLTIIARGNLTSISWPGIAATMASMNYTFTHEACRQHFQKIRRERQKSLGISPAKATGKESSNSKSTTTPRKRAFSSKSSAKHANSDDEEDFQDTPSKKKKKSSPQMKKENAAMNTPRFKMEEGVEVGDEENGVYFQEKLVDLENDDIYGEGDYEA